ncbi:mitoguardin 2-like [Ostrea edulis]|uniref:mitoguardin 2-like n=1 Tax=Ostrea edulis TaxID=37623 RepID=UPI0020959D9D|nr:mitoguardin 2-like [Ostrea edulis]
MVTRFDQHGYKAKMPYTDWKLPVQLTRMKVAWPSRITSLSVTLGMAIMGMLAFYFRYQRKVKKKELKSSTGETSRRNNLQLPNGDIHTHPHGRYTESPSSLLNSLRQKSLSGSVSSIGGASSASTITHQLLDTSHLSPTQLCKLGFETLQQAVIYWEDGLMKLSFNEDRSKPSLQDPETAEMQHQMDQLLDAAYRMIDTYERRAERQADHIALETALAAYTEADLQSERTRSFDAGSLSDQDSFVSATDMANLSDLDNHREMFQHLPLYEAGLLELKHGHVPCRTLRTEMTHCISDTEFLAKLHCIRLAFNIIFQQSNQREYFKTMGKQLIGDLMIRAERDPDEFFTAYNAMTDFIEVGENWLKIEEELKGRGVKYMSFYDIMLDFILMDAFDDLENPPSSVIAVIQNRWLSNSFKETALSTAVWSVLKAKRRLLKFSDGFISKFYSISEHTSPVLAWGFMGPESELKGLCMFFKESVLQFLRDMFSFEYVRYTTVDELADDIAYLLRNRIEKAVDKISVEKLQL